MGFRLWIHLQFKEHTEYTIPRIISVFEFEAAQNLRMRCKHLGCVVLHRRYKQKVPIFRAILECNGFWR